MKEKWEAIARHTRQSTVLIKKSPMPESAMGRIEKSVIFIIDMKDHVPLPKETLNHFPIQGPQGGFH